MKMYEFRLLVLCLIILAVMIIASCTPMQSVEELEAEALRTGDWSAVQAREKRWAYRNAMDAASVYCRDLPHGRHILVCVDLPTTKKVENISRYCSCVSRQNLRF